MRKTAAQRYNDKMDAIFEQAKVNNAKYAPLHLFQVLTRLTEKVEGLNAYQHAGGALEAEDWAELYQLTNEARAVLERTEDIVKA